MNLLMNSTFYLFIQDFHGLHYSAVNGVRHFGLLAIEDQHLAGLFRAGHRESRRPSRQSSGSSPDLERAQGRQAHVHGKAGMAVGHSPKAFLQRPNVQGKAILLINQVRLGQVRFGLVWFGLVRLGQVRLGQARLGQAY